MEELTKVTTYQEYKQAMDTELRRSTESFVRIGYLLKVARDTDILKDSGYANVNEFAQAEYNIDKTQVSRFIHINDRFSEGGYSDRLLGQYQNFGYAKLTIMLQLPEEVNAMLTPDYSKSEIQAIKDEVDAEREITDIEVMLEGENEQQKELETNMHKAFHQMFRENPEMFVEVHDAMGSSLGVMETLAPSGTAMISVRIQGMGRFMISIREDEEVQLVNVRTGEMEKYPWQQCYEMLESLINAECGAESDWERIYGEPFPKKEKIAPVQPDPAPTKPAKPAKPPEKPRKESKVVKAKPVEKKETSVEKAAEETEEQIPGQMEVSDFKEILPEEPEVAAEDTAEEPESGITAKSEEDSKRTAAGYKAAITTKSNLLVRMVAQKNWKRIRELAEDIVKNAELIIEMEEN